jgi:hypothetical protein
MNELRRRIAALESRTGAGRDCVEVIIRTFVSPGPNGPVASEPRALVSASGSWRIDREPGESAEAFMERARQTVPRPSGGVARLVQCGQ